MPRAPYKITKRFQRLIVQRAIEGFSSRDILDELREKDVFVSYEAVRYYLRANARQIAEGLETQWERAVVLEPDMGLLKARLAQYQRVINREMARDKPSNRIILDAISAAGQDVHAHEANLIRFKKFVTKQDEHENEEARKAQEIEEMKVKWDNFVRSVQEAEERVNLLEAPEEDGDR